METEFREDLQMSMRSRKAKMHRSNAGLAMAILEVRPDHTDGTWANCYAEDLREKAHELLMNSLVQLNALSDD